MSHTSNLSGPQLRVMRTQLGRVRGLGAAKAGTAHWWAQRLTAVALLPLTLWFLYAALHLVGAPRAAVAHWAGNPINAALLVALVVVTYRHLWLGLQVVIEDYVHSEWLKLSTLVAMRLISIALAVAGIFAVLRLAFGG